MHARTGLVISSSIQPNHEIFKIKQTMVTSESSSPCNILQSYPQYSNCVNTPKRCRCKLRQAFNAGPFTVH